MKLSLRRPLIVGPAMLVLMVFPARAQSATGTTSAVTTSTSATAPAGSPPTTTTAPAGTTPATAVRTHPASEVRIIKSEPVAPVARGVPPDFQPSPSVGKKITGVTPPPSVVAAKKMPTGPIGATAAPLGLPQLLPTSPGGAAPIAAAKYEVDSLLPPRGAVGLKQAKQGNANYLAIDGGGSWSRSLRGKPTDIVFVSFVVDASVGTAIKVGGAWLRVDESSRSGYAELMAAKSDATGAIAWEPLNYRAQLGAFGAQQFALLPVLTVRLDPASGVWDLFLGTRRLADNRTLVATAKSAARSFTIETGTAGAWLCGAVVSDENPLFGDANGNGVPDDFERSRPGGLLGASASPADRQRLADAWRLSTPHSAPPVLHFPRPVPDRLTTAKP